MAGEHRILQGLKRWLAVLTLPALLALAASAQAAYYRYETCDTVATTYPWQDISTTGTQVALADDETSNDINLGFSFGFGGNNYTQMKINANGTLVFDGTAAAYTNTGLPAAAINTALMPYWDDLNPRDVGSRIRYQTLGTSPNRIFVVSFLTIPHYCGGGTGCSNNQTTNITETFQVQLHETTGEVIFFYSNMSTFGGGWTTGPTPAGGLPEDGATIGVQVASDDYTQYSYNTNSIANGSAIRYFAYPAAPMCATGGTRFYMQNAAPDVTVATHQGAWDSSASVLQRKLSRTKFGSIASQAVAETSNTNNYDVQLLKLISEPIPAPQTVAGTLNWVVGSRESNNGMNANWHVHVYAVNQAGDTVRGTLYNNYTEAAGTNEWPTTAVGDGPTGPLTLTPVTIQANDRIVIEAGYVARNTSTTSYTGSLWYGGTNVADLSLGGREDVYPGWWEFSQNLFAPAYNLHHLRVEHTGTAVACNPESVKIVACANADCSSLYTGGVQGTLTAGANSQAFTIVNGASDTTVSIYMPGAVGGTQTVRLGLSGLSQTPSDPNAYYCNSDDNKTTACDVSVSWVGVEFDVPTQTAGINSDTVTIRALRSSTGTSCTPLFQYVTATMVLWASYQNPATGTMSVRVNGNAIETIAAAATPTYSSSYSVYFDGTGTVRVSSSDLTNWVKSVRYDDAGLVRLNARITRGTTTGQGSSDFVTKPYGFKLTSLTCDDADKTSTATGAFCVAGGTFTATVEPVRYDSTAANNLGATTPNFGHESPTAQTVTFEPAALISPTESAGGVLPAFTSSATGSFSGTPNRATATMVWPEVGTITIKPTMDYLGKGDLIKLDVNGDGSIDYDGAADSAAFAGNVGRFYPHHFYLESGSISAACPAGGFTYMDQPALGVAFTVHACNKEFPPNCKKTSNYFYADPGGYDNDPGTAGYQLGTITLVAENANAGTELAASRLSGVGTADWTVGAYTINATTAKFSRDASPDGAFDDLAIGVKVVDRDAAIAGTNMKATTSDDCTVAPDCDAVKVGASTKVRYGRLRMANALGSEMLKLPVPLIAEYYNGAAGWRQNGDDSCTTLVLAPSGTCAGTPATCQWGDIAIGNAKRSMAADATQPSLTDGDAGVADNQLRAGNAGLKLSAPGAGKSGSVTVTTTAPAWLGPNPSSVATFGIKKSNHIFLRESY